MSNRVFGVVMGALVVLSITMLWGGPPVSLAPAEAMARASAKMQAQDYPAAIHILQPVNDPTARLLLGDAYAQTGDLAAALDAYRQSLAQSEVFIDYTLPGQSYIPGDDAYAAMIKNQNNYFNRLGVAGLDIAIVLLFDPARQAALDWRLSRFAGQADGILDALRQAVLARPGSAKMQWAAGHAYALNGQPERALPYLAQAVSFDPADVVARKELARAYLNMGLSDAARDIYRQAEQDHPADLEVRTALALYDAQEEQWAGAIARLEGQTDYLSLKNLAIFYARSRQYRLALATANRARPLAPPEDLAGWDTFIESVRGNPGHNRGETL